jgi:N-acetylmuramoyl-L-alanine amidase
MSGSGAGRAALVALAGAVLALAAPARGAGGNVAGLVVAIDPGHGGEKDGALSAEGLKEKDLTLQVARRLQARLRRGGARVVLTRSGDDAVALAQRAALANAEQADVFVSIHLNSMSGGSAARGAETYFLSAGASDASARAVAARENADRLAGEPERSPGDTVAGILEDLADSANLAESSRLAQAVHERVARVAGTSGRGVRQAPFYVLAGARMPAILVELGFLSHPEEGRLLGTAARQEALARAIAEGIAAWRASGRRAGL